MKEDITVLKERRLALLLISLAVIFWGYSFISTKTILPQIPPASIAFFRQLIAVATLGIWVLATGNFQNTTLKDFILIAVTGFFGIVLYFIFENFGLQYTSASNASMIVAAVPVFTLFSEALFFKFRITLRMIFCLLLSIMGVYFIISTHGRLDFTSASFKGNLLIIGAMLCWVIYVILNKRMSNKYSSIHLILSQSAASIFLFIPFILPEIHQWRTITLVPLLNLLYLGIFCSALGYIFYIYGVKRLGATVAAIFLNLTPVVTVIFGFLVLQETITVIQFCGMALVILSLTVLNVKMPGNELAQRNPQENI